MLRMDRRLVSILVGAIAGVLSGLLGIGGGIVMVPLLVNTMHLSQHRAHATSLAAIVVIGVIGAAAFGQEGEVDLTVAAFLAIGGLVGAPLGARAMATTSEGELKIGFGLLSVAVGIFMVVS
jgi:uncharacterized protein